MVRAEQGYVLSVVRRFGRIPWLCYDLINEPSFSNPRIVFHGNVPNGDPAEIAAWHRWLRENMFTLDALASAWRVTPRSWSTFDSVPLPEASGPELRPLSAIPTKYAPSTTTSSRRRCSPDWVHGMVEAIRGAGSTQLINVGQDEGGVTDRVLNQFYATSGVSFTTNHTYWQDDALLWDSVAAKRPGIPNITGETGYQPVWAPDGTWRYDELTGLGLEERKWALGFAAGSSGAMQWDWDREVDFGMERSDGSAKLWENMMRDLGRFARAGRALGHRADPPAGGHRPAAVAAAFRLQPRGDGGSADRCPRPLQLRPRCGLCSGRIPDRTLGSPRLIILPSAYGLTEAAWGAIEARVRDGAVLLVSGPFDGDAHLHPTRRAADAGISYTTVPLEFRDQTFRWAGEPLTLTYGGMKTTTLSRAQLSDNRDWVEQPLGRGKILFSALPLELNDRLDSVAAVYAYALKAAALERLHNHDAGPGHPDLPHRVSARNLICPHLGDKRPNVSFRDERSGKTSQVILSQGVQLCCWWATTAHGSPVIAGPAAKTL